MHCIQNSCSGTPTPFTKAIAGFIAILAITVIALSIIGLTATLSGPFNAIVQLNTTIYGFLLGTSIFVLILDLVWFPALCKKTKELTISQSELPPSDFVSKIEEISDTDSSLRQLPEEIVLGVLGFLSPIELAKCGEVNRRWKRLSSDATLWNALDLRKISPLLKVFDGSDWDNLVDLSAYGLSIKDVAPLDKRKAIPVLKKFISSLFIEGNAGVTLLTIPKGLTFKKLIKLVGSPKVGNITPFRYIWDPILNEIGDTPVDKTYRIVIMNNVLEGSRNLFINDQKALVNQARCEMPKLLEVAVLLVVTFMVSGERLYNDNPWTYTCCSEQVAGRQVVVGGFASSGGYVHISGFANDIYGIGGVLRKF